MPVSYLCDKARRGASRGQHRTHDFLTDNPIEQPPQGQKAPPSSFANEIMISGLLAGAGYQCGYVGKWHMGNNADPGHGYSYTYLVQEAGPRVGAAADCLSRNCPRIADVQ